MIWGVKGKRPLNHWEIMEPLGFRSGYYPNGLTTVSPQSELDTQISSFGALISILSCPLGTCILEEGEY